MPNKPTPEQMQAARNAHEVVSLRTAAAYLMRAAELYSTKPAPCPGYPSADHAAADGLVRTAARMLMTECTDEFSLAVAELEGE